MSPPAPAPNNIQIIRPVPAPGPLDNPLKGWCVYTDAGPIRQPYSLVYHYVSWKTLEPQPGKYAFAAWEKTWDDAAGKGKRIVFRVYLDYPGLPSGVPDWLRAQGLRMTPYTDYGGGLSPDYDNPVLVTGLLQLIAALGRRYDHNPRVAFIEVGLLGFWGEWHTYPHPQWFASAQTQKQILAAYRKAFPDKILMLRYPEKAVSAWPTLGFHDDMFPADTDTSLDWHFLARMASSGCNDRWKQAAMGGEMVPGGADQWMLGAGFAHTEAMVAQGHFTWIGPYGPALAPDQTPDMVAHSQALVRRMGYEFRWMQFRLPRQITTGKTLRCVLWGRNEGVAPFYDPWPVQMALLNSVGKVVEVWTLPDDLRRWLPGTFTLRAAEQVTVPPGPYRLALGIRDPWTGQPDVQFANALPYADGWTVLASIVVTNESRK